jgi:hypothetical protein
LARRGIDAEVMGRIEGAADGDQETGQNDPEGMPAAQARDGSQFCLNPHRRWFVLIVCRA